MCGDKHFDVGLQDHPLGTPEQPPDLKWKFMKTLTLFTAACYQGERGECQVRFEVCRRLPQITVSHRPGTQQV